MVLITNSDAPGLYLVCLFAYFLICRIVCVCVFCVFSFIVINTCSYTIYMSCCTDCVHNIVQSEDVYKAPCMNR